MTGAARRGSTWTPERIETLKRLAADGMSSTLISERFGLGRGAIIGKCSRLGLTLRGTRTKRRGRPTGRVETQARKPRQPNPVKVSSSGASPERRTAPPASSPLLDGAEPPTLEATDLTSEAARDDCVGILDLKNGQCRFPIGDKFCGDLTCERGSGSYCEPHADRCYAGIRRKPGPKHPHSNFQFSSRPMFTTTSKGV